MKKVVVFIPCFNEEETIEEAITKTKEIYRDSTAKGFKVEILVVDDGSTDKTLKKAKALGVDKIVSHPTNLGLGAATRTGMQTAFEMDADVLVKLDADLQHDPKDIENVAKPLLEDKADICWGTRFKGGMRYKMPLVRMLGNHFFTFLMNWLTDYQISDGQTGMIAFNRRYLGIFEIMGNYNCPQQLLIDASFKHMRYTEVPTVFHQRTTGSSFVTFKYPFKAMSYIAWVLIYANPLKSFSLIGLTLISVSLAIFLAWIIATSFRLYDITSYLPTNTCLLLFLSGVQAIFFGLLADMIMRKRNK